MNDTFESPGGLWDLFQLIRPNLDGTALCAQVDPNLWFPEKGDNWTGLRAKQICAECPSRAQCLEDGLADPSLEGIWGGLTLSEREAIRGERDRERVAA